MFDIADIVRALVGMTGLSVNEFERISRANGWTLVRPTSGLTEATANYPLVLDTILAPPLVLCPFWSVEDHPREEWRPRLRASFDAAVGEVVGDFRPPDARGEWGNAAWAFAIWRGPAVDVSVEETNYEDMRVPFLVVACALRISGESPSLGLTARCFSGPDDVD